MSSPYQNGATRLLCFLEPLFGWVRLFGSCGNRFSLRFGVTSQHIMAATPSGPVSLTSWFRSHAHYISGWRDESPFCCHTFRPRFRDTSVFRSHGRFSVWPAVLRPCGRCSSQSGVTCSSPLFTWAWACSVTVCPPLWLLWTVNLPTLNILEQQTIFLNSRLNFSNRNA